MGRPCLIILLIGFAATGKINAQSNTNADRDTVYTVRLKEVKITAQRKWANEKELNDYNNMWYFVTTVLPYVKAVSGTFLELNAIINDPNVSKKERKRFTALKEAELREKFESQIRKLNITQGILLVKLIGRQTDVNIYKMLHEFKNPFEAVKWQTWARLHGLNLNERYNPGQNADLEYIMEKMGYPLPLSYGADNNNVNF